MQKVIKMYKCTKCINSSASDTNDNEMIMKNKILCSEKNCDELRFPSP